MTNAQNPRRSPVSRMSRSEDSSRGVPGAVEVDAVRPGASTTVHVLSGDDVSRALVRMAHEIVERNSSADLPDVNLYVIGIQTGGVWIAERLASQIRTIDPAARVHVGSIDVALFRDDISLRPISEVSTSSVTGDLTSSTVVLVDDVLFTGRTVRAALDALTQFGRPARVQLATLIDRGHRELPIRPDYVGKNLPTSRSAEVTVDPSGVQIVEGGRP